MKDNLIMQSFKKFILNHKKKLNIKLLTWPGGENGKPMVYLQLMPVC